MPQIEATAETQQGRGVQGEKKKIPGSAPIDCILLRRERSRRAKKAAACATVRGFGSRACRAMRPPTRRPGAPRDRAIDQSIAGRASLEASRERGGAAPRPPPGGGGLGRADFNKLRCGPETGGGERTRIGSQAGGREGRRGGGIAPHGECGCEVGLFEVARGGARARENDGIAPFFLWK
jgi:hypothetical protein